MSRSCPDCQTDLEQRTFHGVTIDACVQCAGIFFDSGEVNQIKAKGLATLDEIEEAIIPTITQESSATKARFCPCCMTGMDKFRYMYTSKIVLDECEKCGGIWVQDGELGRMREFLAEQKNAGPIEVSVISAAEPRPAFFAGRLERMFGFLRGVGSGA